MGFSSNDLVFWHSNIQVWWKGLFFTPEYWLSNNRLKNGIHIALVAGCEGEMLARRKPWCLKVGEMRKLAI